MQERAAVVFVLPVVDLSCWLFVRTLYVSIAVSEHVHIFVLSVAVDNRNDEISAFQVRRPKAQPRAVAILPYVLHEVFRSVTAVLVAVLVTLCLLIP